MQRLSSDSRHAFERQSAASRAMGSAFMATLCELIAERGLPNGRLLDCLNSWDGIAHHGGDAVPLRLAGALHRLVIDDVDPALRSVYPPNNANPEAVFLALSLAVSTHEDFVLDYLKLPPQTNEVGRSAIFLPVLLELRQLHELPFSVLELGASAGLNQLLPHFHMDYGTWSWGDEDSPVKLDCEWRGNDPAITTEQITFNDVRGCDLSPIDVSNQTERKRLLSYIWPDQDERQARMRGAFELAKSHPIDVDEASAPDWIVKHFENQPKAGSHLLVMHSVFWQYMSDQERTACEDAIMLAGERASAKAPVSWLRFEADDKSPGGSIQLTHFDGSATSGKTVTLGRADFHGRWIEWSGRH